MQIAHRRRPDSARIPPGSASALADNPRPPTPACRRPPIHRPAQRAGPRCRQRDWCTELQRAGSRNDRQQCSVRRLGTDAQSRDCYHSPVARSRSRKCGCRLRNRRRTAGARQPQQCARHRLAGAYAELPHRHLKQGHLTVCPQCGHHLPRRRAGRVDANRPTTIGRPINLKSSTSTQTFGFFALRNKTPAPKATVARETP